VKSAQWSTVLLTVVAGCNATTSSNASGTMAMAHGSGAVVESPSPRPPPPLDPAAGREVGMVFEAYLSPAQEPGEEAETPSTTPTQFRSTGTSQSRAQREAAGHRAHGQVRFSRDLSRAWIDVRVDGIDPSTVNMFHIHCGPPGILGPILVDFSLATNLQRNLADGLFSVEIRNEHIVGTTALGEGVMGAFTEGCLVRSPSLGSLVPTKVSTIAGMAQIALEGELYFNLHTTTQTYFGDIRGQIHRLEGAAPTAATGATTPVATPAAH
jgi:hypothetical protein